MQYIIDFFSYDQCDVRTDHDTILVDVKDARAANKLAKSLYAAVADDTEDCTEDNIDHRVVELNEWLRRAAKSAAEYQKKAAELDGDDDNDQEDGDV